MPEAIALDGLGTVFRLVGACGQTYPGAGEPASCGDECQRCDDRDEPNSALHWFLGWLCPG
jgi:hypothetical protein